MFTCVNNQRSLVLPITHISLESLLSEVDANETENAWHTLLLTNTVKTCDMYFDAFSVSTASTSC